MRQYPRTMDAALGNLIDDICSHESARVKAGLQAVAPHRDTLAAVLCARLAQACAEPERWTGGEGQPSPTFLLYIAAAWKLTEAHPFVVALLRLPPKQCDAVLGDFITEGGWLVLADTWPGDLRAIEALAFDERAEPFARGAALHSAALLVARGKLPRETALALLTRGAALPLDPARESDATFADQIVSTALDLRAWELRDTISGLFERELTDPWFCGDLDEVLDELPEGALFDPDSYRFPPPIEDAWKEVKDWCWFDDLHPKAAKERDRHLEAELAQLEREEPAIFAEPQTIRRTDPKIGRNEPCPCGSGKKYKKCCGA